MPKRLTSGERAFAILNYSLLGLISLLCVLPMVHILALSLSSKVPAASGEVGLWPVELTFKSYEFIVRRPEFLKSLWVTAQRLVLGVPLNLLLTVMIGYPLAQDSRTFRLRTVYVWYFVITILFSGGLIPLYMTIRATGLLNSILALVLPGAVPVFSVVLVLNFFRALPKELQESAFIDGAGHWRVLLSLMVPLSAPVMATIGLFAAVGHWNSWFDGLIFMNSPEKYPLQTYLQTVVIRSSISVGSFMSRDNWLILATVSDKTARSAQLFLAALPILMVYPLLQRHFIKGIILGSVKG